MSDKSTNDLNVERSQEDRSEAARRLRQGDSEVLFLAGLDGALLAWLRLLFGLLR